jgi:hypothetical protein
MSRQETPRSQHALLVEIAELKRQLANETSRTQRSLLLAIVASLVLHGLVLLIPRQEPKAARPASRLEASFAVPTPQAPALEPAPPPAPAVSKPATPARPPARRPVIAIDKSRAPATSSAAPKWTIAQKEEMNSFLRELERQPQASPRPSLAQRSLAMAREFGRQQARQDQEGSEILERLPNSEPPDPFSVEMYLDALVKKLNRSAGFVRNDPRTRGLKNAAVRVRLNPDGSLQSFKILNAGDQQDQIAFVKSVVEQSVPFAPFPSDLRRSAKSLNMTICIQPAQSGSGGFGFSRLPEGRGC